MPNLTPLTEAVRVAQAVQAMRLFNAGIPLSEACEKVGISLDQYYRWLERGEEVIQTLRETIAESERVQLAEITAARLAVIRRIIGSIPETARAVDLILIDQHLLALQRELEDRHGAHGVGDEVAEEFLLNGPHLVRAPNRIPTVNLKALPDGSVDVSLVPPPGDIIDADPS